MAARSLGAGPGRTLWRIHMPLIRGSLLAAGTIVFVDRSEEHTSELQSLMRISYAVFCLKKKKKTTQTTVGMSILTYLQMECFKQNHKSLRLAEVIDELM